MRADVKIRAFVWGTLDEKKREWKQELMDVFQIDEQFQKYWDKVCIDLLNVCFCDCLFRFQYNDTFLCINETVKYNHKCMAY